MNHHNLAAYIPPTVATLRAQADQCDAESAKASALGDNFTAMKERTNATALRRSAARLERVEQTPESAARRKTEIGIPLPATPQLQARASAQTSRYSFVMAERKAGNR